MTRAELIAAGYRVYFRWEPYCHKPVVYARKPGEASFRWTMVDSGRWMDKKIEDWEMAVLSVLYRYADLFIDFACTDALCYCGRAGVELCDYCSGLRCAVCNMPWANKANKTSCHKIVCGCESED